MNDSDKGICSNLTVDEIERVIKELLYRRYITEKMKKMKGVRGIYAGLLTTTKQKVQKLERGAERIIINMRQGKKEKAPRKQSKPKQPKEESKKNESSLDR